MTKDPVRSKLRVHPGEILKHDFLGPLAMSATALARELAIPPNRLTEIVAGRRGITADTAIRLARYWGTSIELWLNLQAHYDVAVAAAGHDYSAIRPRAA
jgi:addiction module HigA family antidote